MTHAKPLNHAPWMGRIFLTLGALSAAASVVLSAAFAHLPVFAGGLPAVVQTALSQHQFHSLGLLLVGVLVQRARAVAWFVAAGSLLLLGLVLFSFNVYARTVWGFDALRGLVPWGGGAWILAWLALAMGAVWAPSSEVFAYRADSNYSSGKTSD